MDEVRRAYRNVLVNRARKMLPDRESGRLAGERFYAQPAKRTDSGDLYPPEYIDVEISETEGNMKGMYSAKYAVAGTTLKGNPVRMEAWLTLQG